MKVYKIYSIWPERTETKYLVRFVITDYNADDGGWAGTDILIKQLRDSIAFALQRGNWHKALKPT